MTLFYFVRHGKTEWNKESRYQGAHGDSPLLPESYHEIKLLAKHLSKVNFAHAYASPLPRALTTALCLLDQLRQTVPLTVDSRLREFNLGKMEGRRFDEVKARWPQVVDSFHFHADKFDIRLIDSESFSEVIDRFRSAIEEYAQAYPADQNVLVVSHGAALNAGINGLLRVPLEHLKDRGGLSNTSTTVLKTADGKHFQLVKWNETDYLHKTKIDPTDTI